MRPPSVRPGELRAPVLVAPMYAVSGPALVVASCRAGLMGALPARNARTRRDLARWLSEVRAGLAGLESPRWALSVIVNSEYAGFGAELELVAEYRPDVVITALGSPLRAVETVRGYGGAVFADVSTVEHALKAAYAGADGLVLACHGQCEPGAGLSPLAFVTEVRSFFDGPLVVAGGLSTGTQVRAAEVGGADLACVGARFVGCHESLLDDRAADVLSRARTEGTAETAAMVGVPCGWLVEGLGDGVRAAGWGASAGEVADRIVLEYLAARDLDELVPRTPWLRHTGVPRRTHGQTCVS